MEAPNALSIISKPAVKVPLLSQDECYAMYTTENENSPIFPKYWGFDDVEEEFSKNPKIVSELQSELQSANTDKEKARLSTELRKFLRRGLVLDGFMSKPKVVNTATGEIATDANGEAINVDMPRFLDRQTGEYIVMGQAKIVGQFRDLQSVFEAQGATAVGIAFDIEYLGRSKNKTNAFKSDSFDIRPSNNAFQILS